MGGRDYSLVSPHNGAVRSTSPLIYAHRGACLELPENTVEAFLRAREVGARAIETDAHLTRDGRVVLAHDASGRRTANVPTEIRDATLAEVRTWNVGETFRDRDGKPVSGPFRIPTLDEALRALPDHFFNVDAKQVVPNMIPALVRCVREAGAEDRVRIVSFDHRNLVRARRLGYPTTGLSALEITWLMKAPRWLAHLPNFQGDAVQVPKSGWGMRFASQRAIDRLHGLGMRVDFWTIDDVADAARLFAMGADGVVTNDPRAMCGAGF